MNGLMRIHLSNQENYTQTHKHIHFQTIHVLRTGNHAFPPSYWTLRECVSFLVHSTIWIYVHTFTQRQVMAYINAQIYCPELKRVASAKRRKIHFT